MIIKYHKLLFIGFSPHTYNIGAASWIALIVIPLHVVYAICVILKVKLCKPNKVYVNPIPGPPMDTNSNNAIELDLESLGMRKK